VRIGRVAHAPLAVPDPDAPGGVRILGSIEAYRTEDLPPFTSEELARIRHLAAVRGAAMAREAAAARSGIWGKAG
jgi:GAF domain-containing protein